MMLLAIVASGAFIVGLFAGLALFLYLDHRYPLSQREDAE